MSRLTHLKNQHLTTVVAPYKSLFKQPRFRGCLFLCNTFAYNSADCEMLR